MYSNVYFSFLEFIWLSLIGAIICKKVVNPVGGHCEQSGRCQYHSGRSDITALCLCKLYVKVVLVLKMMDELE